MILITILRTPAGTKEAKTARAGGFQSCEKCP